MLPQHPKPPSRTFPLSEMKLYLDYNRSYQTQWLETAQVCYLTVMKVRSPKITVLGEQPSHLDALGEDPFLSCSNFWRPPAFLGS